MSHRWIPPWKLKHVKCAICPVEEVCPYANRHNRHLKCKLRKLVEE